MDRVQIAYTTKFEDVPEEVERLVGEQDAKLSVLRVLFNELQEVAHSSSKSGEVRPTLVKIDEVRAALLAIDVRLADCMNILSGFFAEKTKQDSPQTQQPNIEAPDFSKIQNELQNAGGSGA